MSRVGWVVAAIGLGLVSDASAHALVPSSLELRELSPGRFSVSFRTPLGQPGRVDLRPLLPEHCRGPAGGSELERSARVERRLVDCGPRGVAGYEVGIRGLTESGTNAVVTIVLLDGRRVRAVLHRDRQTLEVPHAAQRSEVALDYAILGARHLAGGADHLLLVVGLVLLLSHRTTLFLTLTAFTLGHSITLGLAGLGIVRPPVGPLEVAIASTLLWLAVELARPVAARRRQRPIALALGFGLLHGFGFAGALREAGLPPEETLLALATFNLGIEGAQVGLAAALIALRMGIPKRWRGGIHGVRAVAAHVIGSLAAFWCIERTAGLL